MHRGEELVFECCGTLSKLSPVEGASTMVCEPFQFVDAHEEGACMGNDIGMEEFPIGECSCIVADPKLPLGLIITSYFLKVGHFLLRLIHELR